MNWIIFVSSIIFSYILLVPLVVKWELNKHLTLPATFFIGILTGAIVFGIRIFSNLSFLEILLSEFVLIMVIAFSLLLWRFYRDPERTPPESNNTILSPADGEVIYVKKIEEGKIPFSNKKGREFSLKDFVRADVLPNGGYVIGIAMNFLDVHVNRAPIEGKVTFLKHIRGLFISLKKKEAVFQNERVFTVIENDDFKVGIVQIASRLVRKIVPYIGEGEEIQRGEKIGVIRFGSQVDLILPDLSSLRINVQPKTKVKAGISIIASLGGK